VFIDVIETKYEFLRPTQAFGKHIVRRMSLCQYSSDIVFHGKFSQYGHRHVVQDERKLELHSVSMKISTASTATHLGMTLQTMMLLCQQNKLGQEVAVVVLRRYYIYKHFRTHTA
jgi:hypothetical protein